MVAILALFLPFMHPMIDYRESRKRKKNQRKKKNREEVILNSVIFSVLLLISVVQIPKRGKLARKEEEVQRRG